MKVVAIIPARGGSKGIPRKNLALLNGKPLIEYAIDNCQKSICDEVWISTDDVEIALFGNRKGTEVFLQQEDISTDTSSLEDVLYKFTMKIPYDILVLHQATSPLVSPQYINEGIAMVKTGKYDSVFSALSMEENDILFWKKENIKPVNYDYMNRGRRQDRQEQYVIETGGFYVTTREQFLKTKNRLGGVIGYVKIPFWSHFEVDCWEDLYNIETLLSEDENV